MFVWSPKQHIHSELSPHITPFIPCNNWVQYLELKWLNRAMLCKVEFQTVLKSNKWMHFKHGGVNPETRPNWQKLRFQFKKIQFAYTYLDKVFTALVTEASNYLLIYHKMNTVYTSAHGKLHCLQKITYFL